MEKTILIKRVKIVLFSLRVLFKNFFENRDNPRFLSLDHLLSLVRDKNSITVVCSGPSANNLIPNSDNLYLVTNDSYKLVSNYDFLYYVGDGYFFRRFLVNSPYCKKHKNNIFLYRREDKLHFKSFKYFTKYSNLLKNDNFLISNFENDFDHSNYNYNKFVNFLNSKDLPVKFQNSGIFLLLFGFYLADTYDKKLIIYGLDLGMGGNIHFDKEGYVGKSVTNDSVKKNTKKQLDIIYGTLNENVTNYSFFNTKV